MHKGEHWWADGIGIPLQQQSHGGAWTPACARQWASLAASLEGEVGASCRGPGPRMLCLHLLTASSPPLLLLNLAKICSQGARSTMCASCQVQQAAATAPCASAAVPSSLASLQWCHRGRSQRSRAASVRR